MKVLSTNIGDPKEILWKNRKVKTGIFKYPVKEPIYLDSEGVRKDHVVDRKVHGGVEKACYIYSSNHYPYWKEKYPELEWNYGMFGENLTIQGLDEKKIKIGSIYTLGSALVQVSEPRQPCYKLGVRFGTQTILKEFINSYLSGVYLKVLSPGLVKVDDELRIHKEHFNGVSIHEMYGLIFHDTNSKELIKKAIDDPLVTTNNKVRILNKFGANP